MQAVLGREWSLLLAALVALLLRVHHLGEQALVGDEWHALGKAASAGFLEIASSFGHVDHSIPITLYYRALALTVGVSEPWIRAPFLLAGLATVVALPLAARRVVPRRAAELFAWLLAVAPALVFYSRFARPYALTCPLAVAALPLCRAWWREGRASYGALYAGTVALAGWLHPAALPFALAPLAFHGFVALRGPSPRLALARVARLGALTLLACALLLLPPHFLDPEGLGQKSGFGAPLPLTVASTLRLFAGPTEWAVALLLLPPFVLGLRRLWRGARDLTALYVLASALQLLTVTALAPAQRGDVLAFARYVLPLLPGALLAVACGIQLVLSRAAPRVQALSGPLAGALLLAAGPLPGTLRGVDGFAANHLAFSMLARADELAARVPVVPEFYRELGQRPSGSLTLLEAPWLAQIFANPLPRYQRVHRQRVLVGFVPRTGGLPSGELPRPAPGFALRRFRFVADLLEGSPPDADYLVLHRDLRREIRLESAKVLRAQVDARHVDIAPLAERARERFGAPVYEDEHLVVFALR